MGKVIWGGFLFRRDFRYTHTRWGLEGDPKKCLTFKGRVSFFLDKKEKDKEEWSESSRKD